MGGDAIGIVHLLSQPEDEREKRSIADVSYLREFGHEYIQVINPPFDGEMPAPREAPDRPFQLTPRHYGCWKAHRDAIDQYLTYKPLLICECDCLFVDSMPERLTQALDAMDAMDLLAFTFGYKHSAKILGHRGNVILISQWIETHCYLVLPSSREKLMATFAKPFDTIDYCYTVYLLDQDHERVGTFSDRAVAVQASGKSLLDGTVKQSENYYRMLRYA